MFRCWKSRLPANDTDDVHGTKSAINTLRPKHNGRHFPDDIFKCIFLIENVWISIEISLKFVPTGPISNISALVQKMTSPSRRQTIIWTNDG